MLKYPFKERSAQKYFGVQLLYSITPYRDISATLHLLKPPSSSTFTSSGKKFRYRVSLFNLEM